MNENKEHTIYLSLYAQSKVSWNKNYDGREKNIVNVLPFSCLDIEVETGRSYGLTKTVNEQDSHAAVK